ncbi:MAG: efflux RND transporter periplasmic adaptor subunit [Planctomycetes bacterium]|nr:efflux RND transporter periplasmic adaptor subunit [Planctomycetota bacterium]
MKKIIIPIIIIAIVAGAVYFFYYRNNQQTQAAANTKYQTSVLKRGSLTAMVGATGTVRSNQSATLAWQATGKIGAIYAKLYDVVNADQVLASLDKESLPQSIIGAEADLVTAQRNLDNLRNSDVAKSQAQLKLANAEKALSDAIDTRNSKNYKRADASIVDAARANYLIAEQAVKDAQDAFDQFVDRSETDILRAQALSKLSAAKQIRDRDLANLNYLLGSPDQTEIDQAEANVSVAKANLADAQREWDRLKNGPDPQDIIASEARVEAIKVTINSVNLKAPFKGTVTDSNSLVGDQVNPGTVSFRIDDLSRLLVDVQVPEVDINKVAVGQPSQLSFDAINGKEYNGKVIEVGQVGTPVQGVVNFTLTIEMSDADSAVRPGMTAAVNMVVSQLDNVLLVPNRGVRLENGKHVIYISKNNVPTPITVELGSTSDTYSEIKSGDVKEGDSIILNPPAQFSGPGGGPGGSPFGGGQ